MTAYLGTFGSLVPVGYSQQTSRSASRDTTFTATVGGGLTSRRSPRVQRSWGFNSSLSSPDQIANLQSFVDGEWGSGPFVWVDEWAQVTNMMTARDAAMTFPWSNTVPGGPQTLTDGISAGRSAVVVDSAATAYAMSSPTDYAKIPVLPGTRVTVSAWLNTLGTTIGLNFYNAAGTFASTSATASTVSGWRRISDTSLVPASAAYALVRVVGAGRIAKPAVTWSDTLLPYHAGQGCREAILTSFDQSVLAAWGIPDGQKVQASTTITEVGL